MGSRPRAVAAVLGIAVASPVFPTEEPALAPPKPAIAVLPIHNRSDEDAPLGRIQELLAQRMMTSGFAILDDGTLRDFMRRHRMRYIGGIHGELAAALGEETGVRAALITSLDLYREATPPKAALTARLVSATAEPRILWMDDTAFSGDGSPGFLGLGRVASIDLVLDMVVDAIVDSAVRRQERTAKDDERPRQEGRAPRRFRPKVAYRAPGTPILGGAGDRVAVLPLINDSTTPYAGDMITDQIVLHLLASGVSVVEPGVVRHALLENRQIQPEGPSIPQADVLRSVLRVERIVFGEVMEYRESAVGRLDPVVDFSIRAFDSRSRQVIWASVSHTRGDERVFFFDAGRVPTAHDLASRMAGALVATFRRSEPRRRDRGSAPGDGAESPPSLSRPAARSPLDRPSTKSPPAMAVQDRSEPNATTGPGNGRSKLIQLPGGGTVSRRLGGEGKATR